MTDRAPLQAEHTQLKREYERAAEFARVQAELAWEFGDRTSFDSPGYSKRKRQADKAAADAEAVLARLRRVERALGL